ncbi:hypothetical protein [Pediococcus pentosaceus]|uniref:hypothetical protein n=1 Tax=Pediococcus pentosaceus TaxID=1255 RepID=UPI00131A231C|nr:hypothetical protein [Pediococcus pentosaceus]MBF7133646.1 hypothetical protein [Pediococcus pentosaceus]QPT36982.1 hypothetical protein I6G30_03505 [Pediococcus pentosaceus]
MLKVKYIVENKTWVVACRTPLSSERMTKLQTEMEQELKLNDSERLIVLNGADII